MSDSFQIGQINHFYFLGINICPDQVYLISYLRSQSGDIIEAVPEVMVKLYLHVLNFEVLESLLGEGQVQGREEGLQGMERSQPQDE